MREVAVSQWIIRLVIAIALPTIACSGFYSVNDLDESYRDWAVSVALAYPAALIGGIGLAATLISTRRTASKILAWASVTLLPLILLMVVRS